MAGKLGRSKAQRRRPSLHTLGGRSSEAIFDLRNEGVVLQAKLFRELNLRQPCCLTLRLKPGAASFRNRFASAVAFPNWIDTPIRNPLDLRTFQSYERSISD